MTYQMNFTVPGDAVPSRRRTHIIAGHVGSHQTRETVQYRNIVRITANEAVVRLGLPCPWSGPVALEWTWYRLPPASMSRRRRLLALADKIQPTKRPDLDNIAKVVQDALTGIVYVDDAQICTTTMTKCYGDVPRLEVCVVLHSEEVPA